MNLNDHGLSFSAGIVLAGAVISCFATIAAAFAVAFISSMAFTAFGASVALGITVAGAAVTGFFCVGSEILEEKPVDFKPFSCLAGLFTGVAVAAGGLGYALKTDMAEVAAMSAGSVNMVDVARPEDQRTSLAAAFEFGNGQRIGPATASDLGKPGAPGHASLTPAL